MYIVLVLRRYSSMCGDVTIDKKYPCSKATVQSTRKYARHSWQVELLADHRVSVTDLTNLCRNIILCTNPTHSLSLPTPRIEKLFFLAFGCSMGKKAKRMSSPKGSLDEERSLSTTRDASMSMYGEQRPDYPYRSYPPAPSVLSTIWGNIKLALIISILFAVGVAFALQREEALKVKYNAEIAAAKNDRDLTAMKDAHGNSTDCAQAVRDAEKIKLKAVDFFKGKLHVALQCYRMMRTFVHVLGKHTEKQANKSKKEGMLQKVFSYLSSDSNPDDMMPDGDADPYDYIECFKSMGGISHGLEKHAGRLEDDMYTEEGFALFAEVKPRVTHQTAHDKDQNKEDESTTTSGEEHKSPPNLDDDWDSEDWETGQNSN